MNCEWVKAYYTGNKAKYVGELASHGIGYFILDAQKQSITVAFLRASNGLLPHHLENLTSDEIYRVTRAYNSRHPLLTSA